MTEIEWLLSNDTGTSSRCILAVMTGSTITNDPFVGQPPCDLDDFGRCVRLLCHFPQWSVRLPEVAQQHPLWTGIVQRWEELKSDYATLCTTGWHLSPILIRQYPRTAEHFEQVMREALDEGLLDAGYERHGTYGWIKKDSPDSKGVA